MYLQITTRCNMSCDHCCFNCTNLGEDMSRETFYNAMRFLDGEEYVTIGGGEPTLHPHFREFLIECIANFSENCLIVTNGSIDNEALLLAKLAKNGVLCAELSVDDFHDSRLVSKEVIDAFTKNKYLKYYLDENNNDFRNTRTVKRILKQGRAEESGVYTDEGCACDTLIVKPNGDLYHCACDDAPCYGNINDYDFTLPDNFVDGCIKDIRREIEEEDTADAISGFLEFCNH